MEVQSPYKGLKVALFLGAGASVCAGYRTFQSFPNLIFDSLPEAHQRRKSKVWAIHDLLENIQRYLHMTRKPFTHDHYMRVLVDYRELLQQLRQDKELRLRFVSTTALENQFRKFDDVVERAIEFITERTIDHYSKNRVHPYDDNQIKPLDQQIAENLLMFHHQLGLRNDPNTPFLPVFTTNYDLFIEHLRDEYANTNNNIKNFKLVNGFGADGIPQNGAPWDESHYDKIGGMHYFRLHGCVAWHNQTPDDIEDNSSPNIQFRLGELSPEEKSAICAMLPGNKNSHANPLYAFAFRKFYQVLLNTEIMVFIGFSFQDRDVNHLLLAVNEQRQRQNTTPLKVVIVDPNRESKQIVEIFKNVINESYLPLRNLEETQIACLTYRFGENEQSITDVLTGLPKSE